MEHQYTKEQVNYHYSLSLKGIKDFLSAENES